MDVQDLQNDKLDLIHWISELQDYTVVEKIKEIMSSSLISDKDDIPQWHKDIVLKRIKDAKMPVDAFEMLDNLENE